MCFFEPLTSYGYLLAIELKRLAPRDLEFLRASVKNENLRMAMRYY